MQIGVQNAQLAFILFSNKGQLQTEHALIQSISATSCYLRVSLFFLGFVACVGGLTRQGYVVRYPLC